MRYIFGFILLLFISCDTAVQPEIISVEGKEYSEIVHPIIEHPKLLTPIDSLRTEFIKIARENNFDGRAIIQFTIDSTGNVRNPEIMKFGDSNVNEQLKTIVYSAKFEPAKQKGIPVSVRYSMPFSTEW